MVVDRGTQNCFVSITETVGSAMYDSRRSVASRRSTVKKMNDEDYEQRRWLRVGTRLQVGTVRVGIRNVTRDLSRNQRIWDSKPMVATVEVASRNRGIITRDRRCW
ncbi:hypothetical protein HanIR_Chr10g0458061 [Helianthus annuus]|nr:hypothetical protein HanIR_Chr10g0458061 [Helianthus annuus]